MLVLPKEKSVPKINNPKFLILAGRPKAGKSTIMTALDNNLIIDLENGYQALSALVVQARNVNDFAEIANALKAEIEKNNGQFPYKYIDLKYDKNSADATSKRVLMPHSFIVQHHKERITKVQMLEHYQMALDICT